MAKIEQVGGTHYSDSEGVCPHCGGAIQHWDWACKLPYLAGCVTKYAARFLSKDGFEGLKKALSYVEKMMSIYYPSEYAEWKEHSAYSPPPPSLRGTYSAVAPSGSCTLCSQPFAAHYATYTCPVTAAKPMDVPTQVQEPWPQFKALNPLLPCELCYRMYEEHSGYQGQCPIRRP